MNFKRIFQLGGCAHQFMVLRRVFNKFIRVKIFLAVFTNLVLIRLAFIIRYMTKLEREE